MRALNTSWVGFALCAAMSSVACASEIAMENRATVQVSPVEAAYAEIWNGFYGPGKGKTLLKVSPALLPDGKPAFSVNEKTDEISLLIRLEVNTPAFESWRQDAHRRLAALGAAQCRPVSIGDARARIIGGEAFLFSDDAESRIRNWERCPEAKKCAIAIRVEGLTAKGRALWKWDAPLSSFTRKGDKDFPLPLHAMNRLLDIPPSVWNWIGNGGVPSVDAEIATYQMPITGMTPRRATAIASVRCLILDEKDFVPELAGKSSPAVLKLDEDMVVLPGRDFQICRYEASQALWESVMDANPSQFKGPNLPVEQISWNECKSFLTKLNALPIVKLRGHVYRLPTEEEWEYACKAGGEGPYCRMANGDEVTDATLGAVAWFMDNSEKRTHPVGEKTPNAYGLYDMHGNVWEWTSTSEETDKITKGGGWSNDAGRCERANRNRFFPSHRFPFLGLRLVRTVVEPR